MRSSSLAVVLIAAVGVGHASNGDSAAAFANTWANVVEPGSEQAVLDAYLP